MSKVVDYFLKYVAFDTQSAEDAGTVPSTEKQFALAKLLSEQLKNIGVKDVSMSEHGYVYGTIPANGDITARPSASSRIWTLHRIVRMRMSVRSSSNTTTERISL